VKSARLGQASAVKRKGGRPAKSVAAPASALPKPPRKNAKKKNEVIRVCNTPNPKTHAIAKANIARRMRLKNGKDSSAIVDITVAVPKGDSKACNHPAVYPLFTVQRLSPPG